MRGDRRPRIDGDPKGLLREGNLSLGTAAGRMWMPRRGCVVALGSLQKDVDCLEAFKARSSLSKFQCS